MPYYDYKCKSCGELYVDQKFSIADRLEPTKYPCTTCDEETIILLLGAPTIGDPVQLGIRRPPAHFRDRLRQIEKNYSKPGGQSLKSRYAENITGH